MRPPPRDDPAHGRPVPSRPQASGAVAIPGPPARPRATSVRQMRGPPARPQPRTPSARRAPPSAGRPTHGAPSRATTPTAPRRAQRPDRHRRGGQARRAVRCRAARSRRPGRRHHLRAGSGHDLFEPSRGGGQQVPSQQAGSAFEEDTEPPEESADPAVGRVAATVEDEVARHRRAAPLPPHGLPCAHGAANDPAARPRGRRARLHPVRLVQPRRRARCPPPRVRPPLTTTRRNTGWRHGATLDAQAPIRPSPGSLRKKRACARSRTGRVRPVTAVE